MKFGGDRYALRMYDFGRDNQAHFKSKLVQPELDVWAFKFKVDCLAFVYQADALGDLVFFPHLRTLMMHDPCYVKKVDFRSLASTCRLLTNLCIRIDGGCSTSLLGIGKLSNLELLEVQSCGLHGLTIPREVGSLSKFENATCARLTCCRQDSIRDRPTPRLDTTST